ncbi:MAG: phosphodiester glycosidase family protein, partial [Chitinophagaceae bacterium]
SSRLNGDGKRSGMQKWKMKTAIGGGPVLLQDGNVIISNNEELKFAGKAILDRHPRTAIGYTRNNKIIILVIEGRNPGRAQGATLEQEAIIFKELDCLEAINLDGGGSSCMLLNGLETIRVSDKTGQRPVPAVFLIRVK